VADIYCDATNGNDSTGDGSAGTPYATLQKCVDNASGGDTIWIGDTVAQVLSAAISWTSGWGGGTSDTSWLIIRGWDYSAGAGFDGVGEINGNDAVANIFNSTSRPTYVHLHCLTLHSTTSTTVTGSNYWAMTHCTVHGGTYGIFLGTSGSVANCHVYDCSSSCVYLQNQTFLTKSFIDGASCSSDAVLIAGLGVSVTRNIVLGNSAWGATNAAIGNISDGPLIDGNTLVGDSNAGCGIRTTGEIVTATNNIITGFATGLTESSGHFAVYGYNQFYNNTSDESVTTYSIALGGNSTANPDFVDAAGGDYTPQTFADGYPATFFGSSTTSEIKIGAVQEAGGGGAAGGGSIFSSSIIQSHGVV